MKILIIRFGGIADIILTTPVVRCLKTQKPGVVIHYLVKPGYRQVLEHNPYIDKIIVAEEHGPFHDSLKLENYDRVIDLQNDEATKDLKDKLGCTASSVNNLRLQKWLAINLKINAMPKDLHLVDRYMQTVDSLGIYNDKKGLDYFIPQKEEVQQSDIPASHQLGYIVIAIGSSYKTKKLPAEKLQQLCSMVNHPTILVGNKKEFAEGEFIAADDPVKVYNACGKFSLHETADLIRNSKLVVAYDSALMQIAAAFKKPVVSIWGSTVPSFGRTPYYGDQFLIKNPEAFEKIEIEKLWCRPCAETGKQKCPLGHFKCMKNISTDQMVRSIIKKINFPKEVSGIATQFVK